MDRRGNRGGLEFLPGDRETSPLIRSRLWTLMYWKLLIQEARVYLINHDLISSVVQLTGYYDFVKRVMFHVLDSGYAGAVPLIQADVIQFEQWGFSGNVLTSLALLQGIRI